MILAIQLLEISKEGTDYNHVKVGSTNLACIFGFSNGKTGVPLDKPS